MGRGQEISYLKHLLWATEAMDDGETFTEERRQEGRAAARQFCPPSMMLQNIFIWVSVS